MVKSAPLDDQCRQATEFSADTPRTRKGGYESNSELCSAGGEAAKSATRALLRMFCMRDQGESSDSGRKGGSELEARGLQLSRCARCHLLHHRQHQLAVTVVQVGGITANLAQETHFIFG